MEKIIEVDVRKVVWRRKLPMELLLLADPSQKAVEDYISRGDCYVARACGTVIGVYVLLPTRPFTVELVNIAVTPNYQRYGIGRKLMEHAIGIARQSGFRKMEVGTGNAGIGQIAFYQACGFRLEWIDRDFFTRYYDEPIVEGGIACRDMVRFGLEL